MVHVGKYISVWFFLEKWSKGKKKHPRYRLRNVVCGAYACTGTRVHVGASCADVVGLLYELNTISCFITKSCVFCIVIFFRLKK